MALASLPLWGPSAAPWASPASMTSTPYWGDPGWILGVRPSPAAQVVPGDSPALSREGSGAAAEGRWPDISSGYLIAVAKAESGFAARAHASTSSAAGPFQFLCQTWLLTLHRYGGSLGLGLEASLVRIGADGRARVTSPETRSALLALRYDPAIAAALAGALTRENAEALAGSLGRPPTGPELYAAHLLGPGQALRLLSASRLTPNLAAQALFPTAAASNPGLFYAGGAPRSVRDLLWVIAAKATPDSTPDFARPRGWLAGDELVNPAPESPSY